MNGITIRPIEQDELGIVTEARERREKFSRFIERRVDYVMSSVALKSEIIRMVDEKVKAEVDAIVSRRVAEQARELAAVHGPTGPSAAVILDAVSEATGFSVADLLGPCRAGALARARHIACHLFRELRKDLSLPAIGRVMGKRDHTTIMHALKQFAARKDVKPTRGWMEHPAIKALLP